MRERIYSNKNPQTEIFDLKHSHGGMVEIEFLTQYFILTKSLDAPELTENIGNIALINVIAGLNYIPKRDAKILIDAYRIYRRLQHKQGLAPETPGKVSYDEVSDIPSKVHEVWKKFTN